MKGRNPAPEYCWNGLHPIPAERTLTPSENDPQVTGQGNHRSFQLLALMRPMVSKTIAPGEIKPWLASHLATPLGLIAESTKHIAVEGTLFLGNSEPMPTLLQRQHVPRAEQGRARPRTPPDLRRYVQPAFPSLLADSAHHHAPGLRQ